LLWNDDIGGGGGGGVLVLCFLIYWFDYSVYIGLKGCILFGSLECFGFGGGMGLMLVGSYS
jgi:hypothetical protein